MARCVLLEHRARNARTRQPEGTNAPPPIYMVNEGIGRPSTDPK